MCIGDPSKSNYGGSGALKNCIFSAAAEWLIKVILSLNVIYVIVNYDFKVVLTANI